MNLTIFPHSVIYLLSALTALVIGLAVWFRRQVAGGNHLVGFMFALSVWLSCLLMESVVWEIPQKIFWAKIEYIGFSTAAPLLFQFAMSYTNHKLKPKVLALLWIPPVLNIILTWTNESHSLVWKDFIWIDRSMYLMQFVHGTWYFAFLAFFILLMLVINFLFLQELRRSIGTIRRKFALMIVANVLPLLLGLLQVSGMSPLARTDLTPIGFIISNLLIWYALTHFQLLDLGPIANLKLIESLPDGVVVLDQDRRIFSANPAAERILGLSLPARQPAPELLQSILNQEEEPLVYSHPDGTQRFLGTPAEILTNSAGKTIGTLLMIRDLTRLYEAELKLREEVRAEAVWGERGRMARDMHDSIMQSLHSAYLLADNMKRLAGRRDTGIIDRIMASVRQALREMRLMVYQSNPADNALDFYTALHERLASVEERVGIQVTLALEPSLEIPWEWQRELTALTSEALNNIIKHSAASQVKVSLHTEKEQLVLVVQDNGHGFDLLKPRPGRQGLSNMEQRAARIYADLHIDSSLDRGTRIKVSVPYPSKKGANE